MDTQPPQPQGYQPPLQQPVMQQHTDLPPGTLTKHKSGFPAMLMGLAVGSLLVGGFMYVTLQASKSENAALKAELMSKEKQTVKPSLQPSVPPMGTEAEQPGMDTTPAPQATATTHPGTTATTHLATYQDPNIPALKFTYDKTKWEIFDGSKEYINTIISLKQIKGNGKLILLSNLGSGCSIVSLVKKDNTYYDGTYKVVPIGDTILRAQNQVQGWDYYATSLILKGSNEFNQLVSEKVECGTDGMAQCNYDINADAYLNACSKAFKIDQGHQIFAFYINGSNPQEADAIVKQIKLD